MRPTCSGVMPEKQNIPIWLVTWSQFMTEPSLARLSLSMVLMVMMRSARITRGESQIADARFSLTRQRTRIERIDNFQFSTGFLCASFGDVGGSSLTGHRLALGIPLGVKLGVVEHGSDDASAVDGRVGVHGADDDLELQPLMTSIHQNVVHANVTRLSQVV